MVHRARVVLVVIMVGASACVPYVLPPTTWAVGASRSSAAGARTGAHAEVGFSPFQLSERELHRPWDATLSGTFDRVTGDDMWGAALAAGPILHPWGPAAETDTTNRLMPQLVGRWTTGMRAAAIRVILERAIFTEGPNSDGTGRSHGEAAYGGYLEAGYQWPDSARDSWAITIGLTMRTPAAAGVACCLLL